MGIGAHTDYECFTILWQTEPGLQVQNRKNEWIEATPIDGTFLVNIGDMMMRWTNNLFRSTPHRVVTRTPNERYSFPFFFAANYETVVSCLETCTNMHHPPIYPPTKFGYWVENMHAYSYVYRHDERGRLPNPELESWLINYQVCYLTSVFFHYGRTTIRGRNSRPFVRYPGDDIAHRLDQSRWKYSVAQIVLPKKCSVRPKHADEHQKY